MLEIKYKVIADYPFNKHFKIGQIIDMQILQNGEVWYHHTNEMGNTENFEESFFKSFPHIFEKLN